MDQIFNIEKSFFLLFTSSQNKHNICDLVDDILLFLWIPPRTFNFVQKIRGATFFSSN